MTPGAPPRASAQPRGPGQRKRDGSEWVAPLPPSRLRAATAAARSPACRSLRVVPRSPAARSRDALLLLRVLIMETKRVEIPGSVLDDLCRYGAIPAFRLPRGCGVRELRVASGSSARTPAAAFRSPPRTPYLDGTAPLFPPQSPRFPWPSMLGASEFFLFFFFSKYSRNYFAFGLTEAWVLRGELFSSLTFSLHVLRRPWHPCKLL